MTDEIKLPPLGEHDHPEFRTMKWTELELEAIKNYTTQAVTEDRARRDADHLAELRAYELTVANLREQLAQLELAKLAPYDQTALELCDKCGWKTLVPGEGCLNCERPAWHDAPTGPGLWVASYLIHKTLRIENVQAVEIAKEWPVKWFGPIMENEQ